MITWHSIPFSELSTQQLYQLLKLRVDVFVVEQTCPYPELDGKDILTGVEHLLGYYNKELVACARILPPGTTYDNVSIGRVATKQSARGNGLGHQLIKEALTRCEEIWPNATIDIGAQEHLENFYASHGFNTVSEMYLEDDIPHLDMRLEK
ncbi:GNAT family N-acetyltransferase [Vibrio cyclitrophicus]|uniref:GNAT family N-acetyltransferase n=1 Tax=Vibrio TaxID=662 RepID=UPI00030D36F3|nr:MULTISPECIES: GNAT family N-acetyltransferase [Vibrio]OED92603.1 GNAT family N-acetyltransferase [Vibrio cyclitrophicus ZF30]OEE13221.1 GNAT family N-acetyltransferase [Vibrio cyclitrophicus ZF207]PMJ36057.1 GNAT family N-acetyltransferase [Vibrio cyclitrophicus]PMP55235.1 GNAT family N-acetyltransferase [Vibrio cyclitrophicus]QCI69844.1 GNAT family N-acetyltransferase [Vibrio cyclitrophicus]